MNKTGISVKKLLSGLPIIPVRDTIYTGAVIDAITGELRKQIKDDITIKESAKILGASTTTVKEAIKSGEIVVSGRMNDYNQATLVSLSSVNQYLKYKEQNDKKRAIDRVSGKTRLLTNEDISVTEAAKLLRTSEERVYQLADDGQLEITAMAVGSDSRGHGFYFSLESVSNRAKSIRKIINLTGKTIYLTNGSKIAVSGEPPIIQYRYSDFSEDMVCEMEETNVIGLPESNGDDMVVVDYEVALHIKGRTDIYVPAFGHTECIKKQHHVYVPGFVRLII